jgi:hypothetical protein
MPEAAAEDALAELADAMAARIEANAEFLDAVEQAREHGAISRQGLLESLEREVRGDTQYLKRLSASPDFEIELSPEDVLRWDAVESDHDDAHEPNDDPFRPD